MCTVWLTFVGEAVQAARVADLDWVYQVQGRGAFELLPALASKHADAVSKVSCKPLWSLREMSVVFDFWMNFLNITECVSERRKVSSKVHTV